MSPELHEATVHLIVELGALHRLGRDYCAAIDCLDHNDRRARQLAASEQVLGEWRERNRRTLPAILERLRTVRVVRPSAVVIGDRSRKSALGWLVELGEGARDWILCNDSYLDQLDVLARWLVGELGIDRERLLAEVGVELEQLQGTASTEDRLHIDDIENFAQVQTVQVSAVAQFLKDGRIEIPEEKVKFAIEEILQVPFHQRDRPNELDDIYTANVIVKGSRRPTAFMLKGPGIGKKELTIRDCGKNGDQLVRLFDAPADLFVVQFVGRIAEMVVKDVEGKIAAHHKRRKKAQFLIVDGQDTARLLFAYGKLSTASSA